MSISISYCQLLKATHHKPAFDEVRRRLRVNMNHGAFTFLPCECTPRCRTMSDEELMDLVVKLMEEDDAHQ